MTDLPLPSAVRIVEVGPRDGLQNEPKMMPTDEKIALVRQLAATGLQEVEITSLTHPRWMPNLADAEELLAATRDLPILSWALVPNGRGFDRALKAGVGGVTLVMSASEAHNQANLNRSPEESLLELQGLDQAARAQGLSSRISISVAFACPFSGPVAQERVVGIVDRFIETGATRIGLCDTIGVATPDHVHALSAALIASHPGVTFELHLHDTHGRALANSLAGLVAGITSFDTSIGGLGGCPYAPGATGNCATEDLNAMLAGMGIATGISQQSVLEAATALARWRGKPLDSAALRAGGFKAGDAAPTVQ